MLTITGIFAAFKMVELQEVTEKIYRHPFTVSNAARTITSHFNKMQHDVTAAVLEEDQLKIATLFEQAEHHSSEGLQAFDIIFQRYLGETVDVQNAYQAFIKWRGITQEVKILLTNNNQTEAIKLLQTTGQQQAAEVSGTMKKLIDYAENKAREFRSEALEKMENTLFFVGGIVSIVLFGSIMIGIFVMRKVFTAHSELKRHLHVIDQNVCSFDLDNAGVLIKASNALCRLLKVTIDDILNQELPDIINDDDSKALIQSGLKFALTGKQWQSEEISHQLDTNDIIWMDITITPVLDDEYQIMEYSGVVVDISDKHEVGQLAITDKLTGIYNRRYFDNILPNEMNIARRNGSYLTLAIIDIDYFKNYNDHYGHPSGDNVLVSVANIIDENSKRPNDYIFRIGGEEFALIFSGMTTDQSHQHLENIRKDIEAVKIEHNESNVSNYVTISIGYWVSKIDADIDAITIYQYADKALYAAKEKRNKCVSYSDDLTNVTMLK